MPDFIASAANCAQATDLRRWLEYWLDEIDPALALSLEEHLFGCAACTATLEYVAGLGAAIRRLHCEGRIAAVVPSPFLERMKGAGLRIREYRIAAQGGVFCTITPEDDFVCGHLEVQLAGVTRLDAIMEQTTAGAATTQRLADLPFNPEKGEIITLPNASDLRPVREATLRVTLLAVEPAGERQLGVYTFNHHGARAD